MVSHQDASPIASSSKRPDASAASPAPWYRTIRTHLSSHPPGSMWSTSSERSLLEPYAYLASRPGKEIRSKLIDAFNFWLQVPERRLRRVRKVVDMLHTASLLMDDVEDNSDLRRGLPVAHKVYGTPQVLNTANYVYFLVFKEVEAMGSEAGSGSSTPGESSLGGASAPSSSTRKATQSERLLVEEMINLHRGQGLDLLWRDTLTCPTEEEYVEMVRNKTGGLLRIAGGLMMIWSPLYPDSAPSPVSLSAKPGDVDEEGNPGSPDLLPLLDLIGLLFQIRDDYMNLSAESYAQNKGFAEDLTEGKFSFPMIHGIRWSGGGSGGGGSSSGEGGPSRDQERSSRQTARPAQASGAPPRTALDSPHLFNVPFSPSPLLPRTTSTASSHSSRPHSSGLGPAPNRQLLSILSSRPTDEHLKRYAVSYLRHVTGSFAYCREVMRELFRVIEVEVDRVERLFEVARRQGPGTGDVDGEGGETGGAGRNEQLRRILEALKAGWWEEEDGEEQEGERAYDGSGQL